MDLKPIVSSTHENLISSSPLVAHPETTLCMPSVTKLIETKVDALKCVDLTPNWILNAK